MPNSRHYPETKQCNRRPLAQKPRNSWMEVREQLSGISATTARTRLAMNFKLSSPTFERMWCSPVGEAGGRHLLSLPKCKNNE